MGGQSQGLNSQKTVLASLHCAVTRTCASLDAHFDSWFDLCAASPSSAVFILGHAVSGVGGLSVESG